MNWKKAVNKYNGKYIGTTKNTLSEIIIMNV